jgi:D-alanyl-D-alanine dipeptidase
LTFVRDGDGQAEAARVGWVVFNRRTSAKLANDVYRIHPVRPVAALWREARAAQPPKESGEFSKPDLVELVKLDPRIKLDIRYATSRNFLNTPMYTEGWAFIQRAAGDALVRVKSEVERAGLRAHDPRRLSAMVRD